MAIKTDFKPGDILHASEVNEAFSAIKNHAAAVENEGAIKVNGQKIPLGGNVVLNGDNMFVSATNGSTTVKDYVNAELTKVRGELIATNTRINNLTVADAQYLPIPSSTSSTLSTVTLEDGLDLEDGDLNIYTQAQVDGIIGSLSNLNTTSKTNIVSAINEVKSYSSEVLYDDYILPNSTTTTDTTYFFDSTDILQPTAYIGDYTDGNGTAWTTVFECERFPDWFNRSIVACYPYNNGIAKCYPFWKNYLFDSDGNLYYDFYNKVGVNNIQKELPYFFYGDTAGIVKIDDTHFKWCKGYSDSTTDYTTFDKTNINCSLFAFGNRLFNKYWDISTCKKIRVTTMGNIMRPNKYNSVIPDKSPISLRGYIQGQVLYGNAYSEIELDWVNFKYRATKVGYSVIYRTAYNQSTPAQVPESYEVEYAGPWTNITDNTSCGRFRMYKSSKTLAINYTNNPDCAVAMGTRIKIEKLA